MSDVGFTWLVLGASVFATYIWRAAGMLIGSQLHPDGAWSRWITCVAYAVLAGLIARMMITDVGPLAIAPLPDKLIALCCGFIVLFTPWRSPVTATAIAFLSFMAMTLGRNFW